VYVCVFRFSQFHAGDAASALATFRELADKYGSTAEAEHVQVYIGVCLYYLGDYTAARAAAEQSPPSGLKNRLLLHVADKFAEEDKVCLCMYIYIYMYVCMCVCVCMVGCVYL
jgi:hypothetical protein